ncbi:imelysin family protein [Thalassolituus pacificus]|uniref:Imelysin-like domain-containing protein n=1 Tax=Thalassolituus pacificus TaxID=2975440 RepID=A0A9X3AJC6_9GAMM|nr:imelysin family protein [Thalassolituus pacificus]MCT7360436.1 hypothetical protein [Thalassolituus pacificus]
MNFLLFRSLVFSAAAGLLLTACGGERVNDPVTVTQSSLDKALQELTDNSIIPAVNDFASQSAALTNQAEVFCSAPDAAGLTTLQQQWRTLADSWYHLLPLNFGPADDDLVFPPYIYIDSLRQRGNNYSATVRSEINTLLGNTTELNSSYFDNRNFQYVGLLALEIAIFERASDASKNTTDIVAEYQAQPRKCDIISGLSNALQVKADYIRSGWTLNHKATGKPYRELFLSNQLDDGTPALTQLLTSAQEFLDYLQQRNVATVAAQSSGYNWPLMATAIDSIEEILQGNSASTLSLFSLMTAAGYDAAVSAVRSNIAAARENISNQDALLFKSSAAQLDGNFKREIPDGLEVDLGINFTDGD